MSTENAEGLPLVTPPSGKFIAQLFLVPALIVVVAVGILWGFSWLVGISRTPEQFLAALADENPDVRWRAASDLAQVLNRDAGLASDPHFALELCELLRSTSRDNDRAWSARPDSSSVQESGRTRDAFLRERHVMFLMNCLGNCSVPVGVPLLTELAVKQTGGSPPAVLLRRQGAVYALANSGEKVRQLRQLPVAQREKVEQALQAEATRSSGERRLWAEEARRFVGSLGRAEISTLGVDSAVAECARSEDPTLRKIAAFASIFWEGSAQENRRIEETLWRLTSDDGHGTDEEPALRGVEIRYKAAEGLARRGSPLAAQRLALLHEMLDEPLLQAKFTPAASADRTPDQDAVVSTLTGGLRGVAELHRRRPEVDLSGLDSAVAQLAQNPNAYVRAEAEKTQIALGSR